MRAAVGSERGYILRHLFVKVDLVLETHPGEEGDAEGEIEEAFVGDG